MTSSAGQPRNVGVSSTCTRPSSTRTSRTMPRSTIEITGISGSGIPASARQTASGASCQLVGRAHQCAPAGACAGRRSSRRAARRAPPRGGRGRSARHRAGSTAPRTRRGSTSSGRSSSSSTPSAYGQARRPDSSVSLSANCWKPATRRRRRVDVAHAHILSRHRPPSGLHHQGAYGPKRHARQRLKEHC